MVRVAVIEFLDFLLELEVVVTTNSCVPRNSQIQCWSLL